MSVVNDLLLLVLKSPTGSVSLHAGRIYVDGSMTDFLVRSVEVLLAQELIDVLPVGRGEATYVLELTAGGLAHLVREGLIEITGRFGPATSMGGLSFVMEIVKPKIYRARETYALRFAEEGLVMENPLFALDRSKGAYQVVAR